MSLLALLALCLVGTAAQLLSTVSVPSGSSYTQMGTLGGNGCIYVSGWGYYIRGVDCGVTAANKLT